MAAIGTGSAFELARCVREKRPELEVRMAGTLETAVTTATELCEVGPHLARPYEPQNVVDYIKRLRAAAAEAEGLGKPPTSSCQQLAIEQKRGH